MPPVTWTGISCIPKAEESRYLRPRNLELAPQRLLSEDDLVGIPRLKYVSGCNSLSLALGVFHAKVYRSLLHKGPQDPKQKHPEQLQRHVLNRPQTTCHAQPAATLLQKRGRGHLFWGGKSTKKAIGFQVRPPMHGFSHTLESRARSVAGEFRGPQHQHTITGNQNVADGASRANAPHLTETASRPERATQTRKQNRHTGGPTQWSV